MRITIRYELRNGSGVFETSLLPDDYYAPCDPGESLEGRLPRHEETWKYISETSRLILWDELTIEGTQNDLTIKTDYFAHATLIQISERSGYSELTIKTALTPSETHIVRTHKSPASDLWELNTDVLVSTTSAGAQSRKDFLQAQEFAP